MHIHMYFLVQFTKKSKNQWHCHSNKPICSQISVSNYHTAIKKKNPEVEQGKYKMSMEPLVLLENAKKK